MAAGLGDREGVRTRAGEPTGDKKRSGDDRNGDPPKGDKGRIGESGVRTGVSGAQIGDSGGITMGDSDARIGGGDVSRLSTRLMRSAASRGLGSAFTSCSTGRRDRGSLRARRELPSRPREVLGRSANNRRAT